MKRWTKPIQVLLPSGAGASDRTKERMQPSGRLRSLRNRGHAVIEVALLSPWIFFLFVGTLDMGFYTHALIATQNAARVGRRTYIEKQLDGCGLRWGMPVRSGRTESHEQREKPCELQFQSAHCHRELGHWSRWPARLIGFCNLSN